MRHTRKDPPQRWKRDDEDYLSRIYQERDISRDPRPGEDDEPPLVCLCGHLDLDHAILPVRHCRRCGCLEFEERRF